MVCLFTRYNQVAAVQPVGVRLPTFASPSNLLIISKWLGSCATALGPKWSLIALLQGPVPYSKGHADRQVKTC